MTALALHVGDVYGEIPAWLRWLFYLEAALIWVSFGWLLVLFVRALQQRGRARGRPGPVPDDLLWIFLVPALDEEVTIADSVSRLIGLDLKHQAIVVIDDGSTDNTAQILAGITEPALRVLHRQPPDARRGKAAALNAAWRYIHAELLARGAFARWDRSRVAVVIVDADGRLHQQTPAVVAPYLDDPTVGGVQTLVRIYNRHSFLTWCQDAEFGIYGRLYQLGRSRWGTAGMGGNGQLNRLSALDSVADVDGPWRDTLTEDQDLGLRLIREGWQNRQECRYGVDQQGLNDLSRLLRQRTRWAQGNLQAMRLLDVPVRARIGLVARIDLAYQLLLPVLQLLVAATVLASIGLFVFLGVPFWGGAAWLLFLFYSVTFGSALFGLICQAPRITPVTFLRSVLLSLPYTAYAWLVVPALVRALYRQATARQSWTKTAREPLEHRVPG